jgi:hypothetical protein
MVVLTVPSTGRISVFSKPTTGRHQGQSKIQHKNLWRMKERNGSIDFGGTHGGRN